MTDEGINQFGYTDDEHTEIALRVNLSHMHDYDGTRRAYADRVSTSEALRNRRKTWLANTNGHADPPRI